MKKGKIIGLLAIPALLLTGCIDSMPELTKEQSDMISEYAADLLLKYSPNYNYKIVDEDMLVQASVLEQGVEELTQEILTEEILEETTQEESEYIADDGQETETTEVTTEISNEMQTDDLNTNIAEMFAMDNLSIKYQSYELCDSYPQNNAGFVVDAAQDKKLLVVYFDAEAMGAEVAECNLIGEEFNIALTLNGKNINILNTMLPNEIVTYLDTIEPDNSQKLVALAEISNITEDEILDLILKISNNNASYTFKLK